MTRASHTRVCTAKAPYTNNGTTTITFKETIVKIIFCMAPHIRIELMSTGLESVMLPLHQWGVYSTPCRLTSKVCNHLCHAPTRTQLTCWIGSQPSVGWDSELTLNISNQVHHSPSVELGVLYSGGWGRILTYKCVHTPDLQSGSFYIWILTLVYTCGSVCPCKSDICMLSVWHVLCMIFGFLRFNENNTITYIVIHKTDNCKTKAKITISLILEYTTKVYLYTAT